MARKTASSKWKASGKSKMVAVTASKRPKKARKPQKAKIFPARMKQQKTGYGPDGKRKPIVVALGGNAVIRQGQIGTLKEQIKNLDHAMEVVARLVKKGYNIVITHGNGPQVGNILIQQERAVDTVPNMPLYACVAQSQGLIGYIVQEVLYNKLHEIKIDMPVVSMVTQVVVDRNDPAFMNPSKPIGPYYRTEAEMPIQWHVVETMKGIRRIVPSPQPVKIIETEAIKDLVGKAIVIACGGGGIPVIKDKLHVKGKKSKPGLYGVDAVIDKDHAASKLASELNSDLFLILTNVDGIYLNWDMPNRRIKLNKVSVADMERYLEEGQFGKGSMEPKVLASINFLKRGGKKVLITDLDRLADALKGQAGTVIEH